jgi:polysaccharide deacetylase family protein (PEP-CTERM system associated)
MRQPSPIAQTSTAVTAPPYLFSIDLEDARSLLPDGDRYAERVPANTERIVAFLAEHRVRCTFFTTGDVARRYPSLVRDVAREGHEIACHSSDHTPLDKHDRVSFREDLERCQNDFARAGVDRAIGFRAPYGSMLGTTTWAYDVLKDLGFVYSASVLAAKNPIYGWPDFGPDRPGVKYGIPELPVSLSHLPALNVPFMGGVYFRVLPFPLIRHLFRRRLATGVPAIGYLHPFDVDTDQERYPFPFPGVNGSRFYNWLMYKNRNLVFERVAALLRTGATIVPYAEYVASRPDSLSHA